MPYAARRFALLLAMAVSFLSVAFPHRDSVEAKRAARAPPEAEADAGRQVYSRWLSVFAELKLRADVGLKNLIAAGTMAFPFVLACDIGRSDSDTGE